MKAYDAPPSYKRHRFPPAIIARAIGLYYCFSLSYRELVAEEGIPGHECGLAARQISEGLYPHPLRPLAAS